MFTSPCRIKQNINFNMTESEVYEIQHFSGGRVWESYLFDIKWKPCEEHGGKIKKKDRREFTEGFAVTLNASRPVKNKGQTCFLTQVRGQS